MNNAGRTIVFGDVHGCLDELHDLLEAVEATDADQLVSVGDLISKGPDSKGVLDWAMKQSNLRVVMGNHELRFLEAWRRGEKPAEKAYDAETVRQLGDDFPRYMEYLNGMPMSLELPDALVVHGGLHPNGVSDANLRKLPDGRPWYESYTSAKLAIFGHWVRKDPVVRPNVIGLDTGCVFGGALTALILPERKLVSVPARKVYRPRLSWN